jgi:beta-lactamase class A
MTVVNADEVARKAVDDYAAPGRSALIRIRTEGATWEYGVEPDRPHRAASLLKLGIAIAVEDEIHAGTLDANASVLLRDLAARPSDHSVLDLLDPESVMSLRTLVSLMAGASDNTCTRWLLSLIGRDRIAAAISSVGCHDTIINLDIDDEVPIAGITTCRDALHLLHVASDPNRCPITAHALRHSIRNSRIPLGATATDVSIAHKTGSLTGLAHDVAILECGAGRADIAFLTDDQHDTLIASYAMGICTREVLTAWHLDTTFSVSADGG